MAVFLVFVPVLLAIIVSVLFFRFSATQFCICVVISFNVEIEASEYSNKPIFAYCLMILISSRSCFILTLYASIVLIQYFLTNNVYVNIM